MTGPDGEKARGWWTVTAVDPPHRLEFDDGFASEDGEPDPALGATHGVVTFEAVDGGTRMTTVSTFESADQLEQMSAMGMEEGMREAMGQIDGILAEETPDTKGRLSHERLWVVDPMDGTKEFIKRNGEFTVNIALCEAGRPVLGVVAEEDPRIPRAALAAALSESGGTLHIVPGTGPTYSRNLPEVGKAVVRFLQECSS